MTKKSQLPCKDAMYLRARRALRRTRASACASLQSCNTAPVPAASAQRASARTRRGQGTPSSAPHRPRYPSGTRAHSARPSRHSQRRANRPRRHFTVQCQTHGCGRPRPPRNEGPDPEILRLLSPSSTLANAHFITFVNTRWKCGHLGVRAKPGARRDLSHNTAPLTDPRSRLLPEPRPPGS